jgi:hypothetical protein
MIITANRQLSFSSISFPVPHLPSSHSSECNLRPAAENSREVPRISKKICAQRNNCGALGALFPLGLSTRMLTSDALL